MHYACTWLHGFDSVQCIQNGVLERIRHSYVECDGLILQAVRSSLVLSSPIRMVSCWSSFLLGRRTWSWKESCLNEWTCVSTKVVLGCVGSMPRGMDPTNPTTIPSFSTDHLTTSQRGAPRHAWMRQHHARNVEDTVQWRLIPLKENEERNEDVRVTGEDGTNETKAKQTERRRTNDRDVPRADPLRWRSWMETEDERLNAAWEHVQRFVEPLVHGFVWYRQAPTFVTRKRTKGVPAHIAGHLCYGDSVVDEWFVVFLLQAITEKFPELVAQVWDHDGEFLLIEAACVLPDWLEPETSGNRVFLKEGCLHILPLEGEEESTPGPLVLGHALERLRQRSREDTRAASEVQEAIHRRIRDFPNKAKEEIHGAVCLLPRGLGLAVDRCPELVSWAIATLYLRDLDDMKAVSRPSDYAASEKVPHKIRFSRCRYAQLVQQNLEASGVYPLPAVSSTLYPAAERGMKLALGCLMLHQRLDRFLEEDCPRHRRIAFHMEQDTQFQILCRERRPPTFEEDVNESSDREQEELERWFVEYQKTGEYRRFVRRCREVHNLLGESTRADSSEDGLRTLSKEELFDDDDGWLAAGDQTIQSTLDELERVQDSSKGAMQEVEDLAERMRDFFAGESAFEGVEVGDEFDAGTLDPNAFIAQMREALGFPDTSESDASDANGSDVDRPGSLAHDSEPFVGSKYRELSDDGEEDSDDDDEDAFYRAYDARLREELRTDAPLDLPKAEVEQDVGATARGTGSSEPGSTADVGTSADGAFDMRVVENWLASYAAQEGMPGPVSNFAGLFGITVPDPIEQESSDDPT